MVVKTGMEKILNETNELAGESYEESKEVSNLFQLTGNPTFGDLKNFAIHHAQ